MIQNYEILDLISEGGMGKVFLAKHVSLDRKVAVKKLHSELTANFDFKQRFLNEAKILAKLSHPNIITIFDFIEEGNDFYIIMEYVKGETIDVLMKNINAPLNYQRGISIFKKILSAFTYAHQSSIIHRDIKPSNIIIDTNDTPKVLDFGIAKILQSDHNLTKTGTKMGSLYYMSPEQVMGKDVDHRTDIYSLGILLYEMLTNKLPYQIQTDTEYEIMECILKQDIFDINSTEIPQGINNVIRRATAKNVYDRFQTMEEFMEAIGEYKTFDSGFNTTSYGNIRQDRTKIQSVPQYIPYEQKTESKSSRNILYFISGGVILLFIALIIVISSSSSDTIVTTNTIPQTTNKDNDKVYKNLNPTGKYYGTIKDGTRWEVEIYDFNGTSFKGWNTIYWSFRPPTGLTSSFEGVYDFNTGEIKMYEDMSGKKTGKFIGKFSNDGNSISGDFIRYVDNGTYSFNLNRQ